MIPKQETTETPQVQTKVRKPINWKNLAYGLKASCSLAAFLAGIFAVLYYIWGPARGEFHADCTDTILWAEAAMQGKGLINPDFGYAAVMPFGGNLFMQLWIPFFGVSMLTHALGMTTFFLVFTAALYWLLCELKWSCNWRFVTVGGLLTALCAGEKIREIFWGHIIYYSLGMLFLLLGLSLVLHIYHLYEKKENIAARRKIPLFLGMLLVMFIIFCTNSTTAIALFSLPVIGSLFCERFLDYKACLRNGKNLLGLTMLVICGISTGAGMLLGQWIAKGVTGSYANAHSRFSGEDSWWSHLEDLPLAFLRLTGLCVDTDAALMSLSGVNTIVLIAYTILIVILPVAALISYRRISDTGFRMLIWAHFVSGVLILIGYICGMLYTANWRLSPLIVTGFLVSMGYLHFLSKKQESRRVSFLLLLPVGYYCLQSAVSVLSIPANNYLQEDSYRLAQYLQEEELTYGYATFWNSQAITLQSDSACKVRTVSIDDSGIEKNTYQSNIHWFEEQPDQEEYFLLLTAYEERLLLRSDSPVLTKISDEKHFEDYTIWIFEENLF